MESLFKTKPQTDRQKKSGWTPEDHEAWETAEAEQILHIWNDTFKGVSGASRVQAELPANQRRVVRRLRSIRAVPTGKAPANQPEITVEVIRLAIKNYRDGGGFKGQKFQCFKDWFDYENITKWAGPDAFVKKPDPKTTAQLEAHAIANRLRLTHHAFEAQRKKLTFASYLEIATEDWNNAATIFKGIPGREEEAIAAVAWCKRVNGLYKLRCSNRFRSPDEPLLKRAREVFRIHYGRDIDPADLRDKYRLGAIELALIDLEIAAHLPAGRPPAEGQP
jgi:hypothetical protein